MAEHDPFKMAAERIFATTIARPCVLTRAADSERVVTRGVLDKDVAMVDEVGDLIDRTDTIALLWADVGRVRNGDTVKFTDNGETYTIGRKIEDDGYDATFQVRRNA